MTLMVILFCSYSMPFTESEFLAMYLNLIYFCSDTMLVVSLSLSLKLWILLVSFICKLMPTQLVGC